MPPSLLPTPGFWCCHALMSSQISGAAPGRQLLLSLLKLVLSKTSIIFSRLSFLQPPHLPPLDDLQTNGLLIPIIPSQSSSCLLPPPDTLGFCLPSFPACLLFCDPNTSPPPLSSQTSFSPVTQPASSGWALGLNSHHPQPPTSSAPGHLPCLSLSLNWRLPDWQSYNEPCAENGRENVMPLEAPKSPLSSPKPCFGNRLSLPRQAAVQLMLCSHLLCKEGIERQTPSCHGHQFRDPCGSQFHSVR